MSENISHLPRGRADIGSTSAIPGYLAGTWTADPARSELAFSVRLLAIGKARGRFTGYGVTIVTGADPRDSSVTATIDLTSIDTRNARRDHHLRSADFLDVEHQTTMSYRSTGVRPAGDRWVIDGDLTLHDVVRPVPLTVAAPRFDPDGRAHFTATAQLNRSGFGIDRWTGGGAAIGDKVSITFAIDAVRAA